MTYPLTPGLLISMSIRTDHSFGTTMFEWSGIPGPPLEEKQINLISGCFEEYKNHVAGLPVQVQRLEEIQGEGFYRPELEEQYCNWASRDALNYAEGLVKAYRLIEGLEPPLSGHPS